MRAVLTFHSVDDRPGPLSYSAAAFDALLEALARADLPVLSLDELMSNERAHGVALTFDDGMSSVFDAALPILAKHQATAHVFVISRRVGGEISWPGTASFKLMDWDQLAALHAAGIRIEGHTASHPDLRSLSETEIEAEMEEADSLIEARLGRRPNYFAYPFGHYDDRARAVARKRYAGSFTTKLNYLNGGATVDALPRLDAHYLRSPALVRALPSIPAQAYMRLRRALRVLRGH